MGGKGDERKRAVKDKKNEAKECEGRVAKKLEGGCKEKEKTTLCLFL